ncbi:MAG: nitroreductase family protein [Thermoproteota archaeon]|nr:nitroreductase family protein [Candidatus Brockarchaeota archaeon]
MDVEEAIQKRIEVRQFNEKPVPKEIKLKILEAARLASSGMNSQHWRFILIDSKDDLKKLAEYSFSGKWISNANFAIIVLTNPSYNFHQIDAGRTITYMQLMAWNYGIGSCIYTGVDEKKIKEFFRIPENLTISAIVGFGYPAKRIVGKKKRLPLEEIAFYRKYNQKLSL